jgi:hypothetical protein
LDRGRIWRPEFATTREFLARFGIAPRDTDQLIEEDVLKAIRARGWEPRIEREADSPGWVAEITERRTLSQSRSAFAHGHDRMTTLLDALRLALTWPTEEEEAQAFEEQTRALLGLSAADFIKKWHANELDPEDPRVVHLLIARPLGW